MVSLFDLEKLNALLKDFYQITGIRITVFDEDQNELVSYPHSVAPYCEVIRGTLKGFEACMSCDREACRIAAKRRGTYIYRCHAGFTEAVTPLFIGEVLAGYLLFGHIFPYSSHEQGWKAVKSYTEALQINQRMLKSAVMEAKYIPDETVRSAAHILRAVATYLIMERMASLQQDKLAVHLDAYLSGHFTEKITVNALCDELEIGKTLLYKLSHELYGCGITERVRVMRIEQAKKLLLGHKRYSLSEISDMCGYDNYNYFIAVFSKEVGQSPSAFRKTNMGNHSITQEK